MHPGGGLDTSFLGEREGKHIDIPFFPQKRYYCGPASLAGVMNYWKISVSPDEIADALSTEKHRGTLSLDLYLYAKRKGLRTHLLKRGFEELLDYLDRGFPVIVMVDLGMGPVQKNHFMVVVGYNRKGIFANSQDKRDRFFSFDEMDQIWKRTDYWGLVVSP